MLDCTDADDCNFYVKHAVLHQLTQKSRLHIVAVESKQIFDTITTLHEGCDYRPRPTVQFIRDSFESKDTDTLKWIARRTNIADTLTKDILVMQRLLNQLTTAGILVLPTPSNIQLES